MFQIQRGAYVQTDLEWLVHKIWMLKSNFELVGRKFLCLLLFKQPRTQGPNMEAKCPGYEVAL